MNLGVVFARGGSKGVPRKNLRLVGEFSLTAHAVRALCATSGIDVVAVSSDDDEILEEGRRHGASDLIRRPRDLCTDSAPELLSWKHAIATIEETHGVLLDTFVSVPPTSPLRAVADIEGCMTMLKKKDADICVTLSPAARSPWFNMMREDDEGFLRTVIEDRTITRRQDAPACFDLTTVAYAANRNYVLSTGSVLAGRVCGFEVPFPRSIDIDTEDDLILANLLVNR